MVDETVIYCTTFFHPCKKQRPVYCAGFIKKMVTVGSGKETDEGEGLVKGKGK